MLGAENAEAAARCQCQHAAATRRKPASADSPRQAEQDQRRLSRTLHHQREAAHAVGSIGILNGTVDQLHEVRERDVIAHVAAKKGSPPGGGATAGRRKRSGVHQKSPRTGAAQAVAWRANRSRRERERGAHRCRRERRRDTDRDQHHGRQRTREIARAPLYAGYCISAPREVSLVH